MVFPTNACILILAALTTAGIASGQSPGAARPAKAGQDPQQATAKVLQSGPAAGTGLPACAVHAPSGPFAGKDFDAAAQVGGAPAALLFVHELTRNTAPMITGLDQLGVEFAWTGLQIHTIRIAADRNEAEAAVKRSSTAMNLHRPMLVSTDGVDGPGGYALHRQATLTLVLAKDSVVVRSVAFTDTGRGDLGRLRKLVEEVTGPIPADPAALRAAMEARLTRDPEQLRALAIDLALLLQRSQRANSQRANQNRGQMRQANRRPAGRNAGRNGRGQDRPPAGKPRQGKAPQDAELMALLRRAIQKAADGQELDAVFAAVDKRVGDDAGLRSQAVEMFKLQVSLEYGNEDSRNRARSFLKKHGSK